MTAIIGYVYRASTTRRQVLSILPSILGVYNTWKRQGGSAVKFPHREIPRNCCQATIGAPYLWTSASLQGPNVGAEMVVVAEILSYNPPLLLGLSEGF